MPKQKRPFVVEIEAKLTVLAFDEDGLQEGREAVRKRRVLGIDVNAGERFGWDCSGTDQRRQT